MFTRAAGIYLLSECAPYKHHRPIYSQPPVPPTPRRFSFPPPPLHLSFTLLFRTSFFYFTVCPVFVVEWPRTGLTKIPIAKPISKQAYLRNIEGIFWGFDGGFFAAAKEVGRFLKCSLGLRRLSLTARFLMDREDQPYLLLFCHLCLSVVCSNFFRERDENKELLSFCSRIRVSNAFIEARVTICISYSSDEI